MELKIITLKLGFGITAEFSAMQLKNREDMRFTYTRTENAMPHALHGTVNVDLLNNTVGYIYDCFVLIGSVLEKKRVDDNYYFKCATDSSIFEVYICDVDNWRSKGSTYFA